MTLLGLNTHFGITCDKCHSGRDLFGAMKDNNHTNLMDLYKCKCGNNFSYEQGIINDYCADHFASDYSFISNIYLYGSCEITVGTVYTINLNEEVPIINKVMLSPYGGNTSVCVEPLIIENRKSIKVVSSERTFALSFAPESIIKVGKTARIDWAVYGRTKDLKLDSWRHLLIYAKEQKLNKNFLLSFLSSAMALESYINQRFTESLAKKGIDNESIDIFLKESTMPEKLLKLTSTLLGISWPIGSISKNNLSDIISTRNKVAHGKLVNIDANKSTATFRTK